MTVAKSNRAKKLIKRNLIRGPKSAWICYCEELRPQILKSEPNLKFGDICKKIAARWTVLSSELRQPYVDLQMKDKERYRQAFAALSTEQLKLLRKIKREKRTARKQLLPRPALSTYMQFVVKERATIAQNHPGATFMEIGRLLGAVWRSCSTAEKEKYKTTSISVQ